MISLVGEWKPKVDTQFDQHSGKLPMSPTSVLPHRDHWGSLLVIEEGSKAHSNKHADFASGAHMQTQAGGPVWPWSFVGSSA